MNANRLADFVSYVMENDMQITTHRRTARPMLNGALVRPDETCSVVRFSNEKFDKLVTYLSQNDLQVHGADASSTVGIYSFIKLVGELRRSLRKADTPDGLETVRSPTSARGPAPERVPTAAMRRLGYSPTAVRSRPVSGIGRDESPDTSGRHDRTEVGRSGDTEVDTFPLKGGLDASHE